MLDIGDYGAMNLDGTAPFYFQPPAGTVGGGESVDIQLCFVPDHESPAYADVATLALESCTEPPRIIRLLGSAWRSQMWVPCF
jgi:hypothetical protein